MHAPAARFDGSTRFVIERSLGAGGMGIVYLAHDRERDMRVALKTLGNTDPANLARLKKEFRALAGLAHPNLVELYELFAEDGRWFFTMEAIEGVRFDAWVAAIPQLGGPDLLLTTRAERRSGVRRKAAGAVRSEPITLADVEASADDEADATLPTPVADLARLRLALAGLVDGIEALHRGDKLHCDLKPSNVLITPEGRVVVLDFGLVRERPRRDGGVAPTIEGTPEYLAPEVVRGLPPTPASDWYAVGVMIFQALTGRFPHRGPTFWATMSQKLERDAPRASTFALGVPNDLDELCAALLTRDREERAGADAIRAWLEGAPSLVEPATGPREAAFVGRRAELAMLHLCLEEAAGGGPRSVLVRGPSGMGKSALVQHFVDGLERDDRALVLAGRCYEREQVPFKTLDNVVDVLAARLARLPGTVVAEIVPEGASSLAVLFPVLLAVDAIAALPPPDESVDPSEVRARAAEAARAILGRLSRLQPVVIAIDDLQWGDLDSASFAGDLVDARSADRLLFVASVRSEAAGSEVVRAFRASLPRPVDLELKPLAVAESTALTRSILGAHDDPDRAAQIVREAAGLPFFVAELARHRAQAQRGSQDPPATTLDDVLASRIGELPEDARALLEAACIAGLPLPPSILARACGSARDLLPSLRLLGARSLLRTRHGGALEVEPYHDRIREVAVARLEPARRRALHAGLGDALASERASDPETVAEHLARGGDVARALPFQLRAAERAQHALAFDRAVTLHEQAIVWCTDVEAKASLRESLAGALVLAGRASEAAPIFLACAKEARSERARAALERRAAEEWLKCGRIDEGVDVLRGVLSGVGLRYPDSQREALARAVVRIVRLRASRTTFTERDEGSIPKSTLARVDAARVAGTGLMLVDPLRGYGFLARFLIDALAAGEPRRVAAGLALNAVTLCRGGEAGYAKAKRWLDDARDIGARLDDAYLAGLADACEAGVSVCTGRWKLGAELGLRAPERLRSTTTPATWECTVAGSLARSALLFHGDLATLRPLTARQLRAAEDVGDLFAATYARVHGWFDAAMDDDIERGRAAQHGALQRWSHLGFHAMHFWSLYGQLQYDLYEGRAAQGLGRIARARSALKGSRILAMQFYRIFLAATEASLELGAASGGARDAGERNAARLADTLEKEGTHYASAFAAMIRARIARSRGHAHDAVSWCGRAIDLFDVSEMGLYAAAARAAHGAMVGGESGARERALALDAIAGRGIRAPERWVAMLAFA